MSEKSEIIEAVCAAISSGDRERATSIIREGYPFKPTLRTGRSFTKLDAMRTFLRDGFIDRYSGQRLIFPGVLRLLSIRMPKEFPYHLHWKGDECHAAFYELCPTIDHEVPVARGGLDQEDNWVTTSMSRNLAKGDFLTGEIGWVKHPPGSNADWDGLTPWFLAQMEMSKELAQVPYLRQWRLAAQSALKD